jgi:subtilisin family serine protease
VKLLRQIRCDHASPSLFVPFIVALTVAAAVESMGSSAAFANAPPPVAGSVSAPDHSLEPASAVPGEIIVQIREGSASSAAYAPAKGTSGRTGLAGLDARLATIGAASIEPLFGDADDRAAAAKTGLDRILVVRYSSGASPEEAARALAGDADIVYAEPNFIARALVAPNDPTFASQWAHANSGQAIRYSGGTVGTPDCDTDTPEAWDIETGNSSLILAIIDTGVDTGHPEFAGRVVAGYDYVNEDATPSDDNGHGTACAGIAVGSGNNALGIAGVAWGVRLMPVKVLDASGNGSYSDVASGINFAANNGARILSLSLGGPASSTLQTAINYAVNTKGCAVFAATGNANTSSLNYPAAYSNVIAVGALSPCNQRKNTISCDGEVWWGSNYGSGIDFLAPGVRIHTTDIRGASGIGSGDYITDFNGTSSATPHAAGIGALVWSENPALTNAELVAILQSTCDDMSTAGYDTQTGYGRINARRALENAGGDGGGDGDGGGTPVTLLSEGFESAVVPGSVWSSADANATNGADYWGEQTSASGARVHSGTRSAYCADYSNITGQRYDNYSNADLTLATPVNVSGYTNLTLSFWKWHATYNSNDYLSFQYWNGSAWVEQQRWSGASSTWTNVTYALSGFSTLRFRFVSVTNYVNTAEGAYVDDIVLSGIPGSGKRPDASERVVTVSFVSERSEAGASVAPMPVSPQPAAEDNVVSLASAPPAAPALVITPNPARESASLQFAIPIAAAVSLELFTVDGRSVARLVDGRLRAGQHALAWDGRDASGRPVTAGIYFARLLIDDRTSVVERLVLLR